MNKKDEVGDGKVGDEVEEDDHYLRVIIAIGFVAVVVIVLVIFVIWFIRRQRKRKLM